MIDAIRIVNSGIPSLGDLASPLTRLAKTPATAGTSRPPSLPTQSSLKPILKRA